MKQSIILASLLGTGLILQAQKTDSLSQMYDSIYIEKYEKKKEGPLKLLHAEPLYIDLIRDLGARKGEGEWNVGMGLTDNLKYDEYEALVEYEWAMFDRLAFEVELPFYFFYENQNGINSPDSAFKSPGSRLNSLKLATQWTFLVNEKAKTSLALGYLHEFLLPPFREYGDTRWLVGNLYQPFLVAAKRWGNNFHTLLYTGPSFEQDLIENKWHNGMQAHFSFHYMLPGTRNFIGVENNSYTFDGQFDLTIRPQMRLGITDNLLIGIVAGIPVNRGNQRLSTFFRLIYEPAEHNKKYLQRKGGIAGGNQKNQGLKKLPG
jgi:hypothetical protein